MSEQENCDNCGRVIGKLETAHIHGEHVVCGECKEILAGSQPAKRPTTEIYTQQNPPPESATNSTEAIGIIGAVGCPIIGAIIASRMYDGEGVKYLAGGAILSLVFMLVFAAGRMTEKR